MGSKSRGTEVENDLIRAFYDDGWAPMRAPSSGSATSRELPDVLVSKNGYTLAIELKYSSKNNVYVEKEKVGGLLWVAKHYDADPLLVARWKHDTTFYAYRPAQLDVTDAGKYALRKSDRDSGMVLPPATEK